MSKNVYRIQFVQDDLVYQIYARYISHEELFGFLEVEEIVFGETTSVVVDPSDERIRNEFSGVKRTYIPVHNVMRIDEVDKEGMAKITSAEGKTNVSKFPTSLYQNPDGSKKS